MSKYPYSYDKISCLNFKNISLLKHQKIICKFLLNPTNRGLIVFHSVGSGKTITSLSTANCLLKKYPTKHVIIVTGKSLVQNFKNDLSKLDLNIDDDKLTITSYHQFVNNIKKGNSVCLNSILIIDEAHHFGRQGVLSKAIIQCAQKAFKVMLLTATPVQNNPQEIINLMAMIAEKPRRGFTKDIEDAISYQKSRKFDEVFKCKFSFFKNADKSKYPTSEVHTINLQMPDDYYKEYYKIQEDNKHNLPKEFQNTKTLIPFLNGVRRAVNKVHTISPKVFWIIDKINKDLSKNKKVLIYSAFKDLGIRLIQSYLKKKGITFSEITGEISQSQRKVEVDLFNKDVNSVILITSAGGEGLDLKGVRSIIIMEPHWNQSKIDQVIGRGIRYESHEHLSMSNRHVDIYYLLLTKPKLLSYYRDWSVPSADIILHNVSKIKNDIITTFYKNLERVSIEHHSKCY